MASVRRPLSATLKARYPAMLPYPGNAIIMLTTSA